MKIPYDTWLRLYATEAERDVIRRAYEQRLRDIDEEWQELRSA